ncbi:heme-degrading domain-containing protein [Pontibacillus salicampi]|uniref:Heme-degrading domain-containing protein n=1 Tax=Pontibacillus salicampi TaxID=1449801 RepID=A0ABV6LQ31_9BACI
MHSESMSKLLQEEDQLAFPKFTNEDALQLGFTIIDMAKKHNVFIAVHIERNGQPLFSHLMNGTSGENEAWINRKKAVVNHYNHSSAFIAERFKEMGTSHNESSLLPINDFQAVGGSIPLIIKGTGVVGTITVAGLTPELDHQYAVDGTLAYLNQ